MWAVRESVDIWHLTAILFTPADHVFMLCLCVFRTILLHLPITEIFLAMTMIVGLVMYAYYEGCDPLKHGDISKPDQVCVVVAVVNLQTPFSISSLFLFILFT